MIEAEMWRRMAVRDIVISIELAIGVLEEKDVRDYLSMIAHLVARFSSLLAENLDVIEAFSI